MKRKTYGIFALATLLAFIIWTALLYIVDVAPIGVGGTSVGFSQLNEYVHSHIGVNMLLYKITDWLSDPVSGKSLKPAMCTSLIRLSALVDNTDVKNFWEQGHLHP